VQQEHDSPAFMSKLSSVVDVQHLRAEMHKAKRLRVCR